MNSAVLDAMCSSAGVCVLTGLILGTRLVIIASIFASFDCIITTKKVS